MELFWSDSMTDPRRVSASTNYSGRDDLAGAVGHGPAPEMEETVRDNREDGDGKVHHLGAIYLTKDGTEIQHWTLCGAAGIVGDDPGCPACIAAPGKAVEALGVVSLHDGLEAAHNHIQDIRGKIIEQLAATDKAALN